MGRKRQDRIDEIARLGTEIYDRVVAPNLKPRDNGKVVAIDIDSEAWALGDNSLTATERLRADRPDAEIWLMRVGDRALYRIGGRSIGEQK